MHRCQRIWQTTCLRGMILLGTVAWSLTLPMQTLAQEGSEGAAAAASTSTAPPPSARTAEHYIDDPTVRRVTEDVGEAGEPSLMDRIDGIFATAVEKMAAVLFYRLGQNERSYVEFDQAAEYVRAVDSKGDYVRVTAQGPDDADVLTPDQVSRLDVLGRLATSPDGRVRRTGTLDQEPVEFVVLQQRQAKYIQVGDEFRRLLPMREQLSRDDVLSQADVEKAASLGQLVTNDNETGEAPRYLLSERVGGIPFVVLWLALGAVFFTIYMGFFNVWGFRHAIEIVRGRYDDPDEPGEVTHFQALASALSATVGLGNIAGVAIAMATGGPGAFFWMMACGFFGMTSKFVECTLGQRYRRVKEDGTVLGGPMQYLHEGLKELGLGPLGFVFSIMFAVMCILASFGGGNMFQANQSGEQMLTMLQLGDYAQLESLTEQIRDAADAGATADLVALQTERAELKQSMDDFGRRFKPVFGVVLAIMVGTVIIGGIKRIGAAASKIVPAMCLLYIAACVWIILMHLPELPSLISMIFTEAFTPEAFGGGFLGILVVGVQRAAFSNEAGVGSASIAHSAAKTDEPVREGAVALLGPFIDTIVVCSMTALVILITGAWNNKAWIVDQGLAGTSLTSKAFGEEISFFPYLLSVAVVLFAYSTIISWSYYGERCWERLFGPRSTVFYKMIYVGAAFLGTIVNLGAVLDFSDMMILSMAFPNVFGAVLLAPKVKRDLAKYWRRYQANEFETFN